MPTHWPVFRMTPERRSVEAQDRFLDLLTATGCEVTVDADASEPSFLQYSKRTHVVRGRSGVQWPFGGLGKMNLSCSPNTTCLPIAPDPMRVSTRSAASVKLSAFDSPRQLARTESAILDAVLRPRYPAPALSDEFSVVCQSLPRTDP